MSFQNASIGSSEISFSATSNHAAPEMAMVEVTGLGWSDLGTVTVPVGWDVMNVTRDALLQPQNAVAEACSRSRSNSSGAATSILAQLLTSAPPGVTNPALSSQSLCTWQHAITVSASSAPACIDLGRPYLNVDEVPHNDGTRRRPEGADSNIPAAPRWNWLSTLGTLPDSLVENGNVRLLAGCAGSTVQGLVVRVRDEAGATWHAPSSGWRLALFTGSVSDEGVDEDGRDVLAVVPLPSQVPLEVR